MTKKAKKAKKAKARKVATAAAPVQARSGVVDKLPQRAAEALSSVSVDRALTLGSVFRAVQIISGVLGQFTLGVMRDGEQLADPPLFVRQPEIGRAAAATIRRTTTSLACHGNAYWRVQRSDRDNSPVAIEVLDALRVTPQQDPTSGAITYDYQPTSGQQRRGLTPADRMAGDVVHLRLLELPGAVKGLGPIQAARAELAGALDVRDWGAAWFGGSGVPLGILSTDQPLTPKQAQEYADEWETARSENATAVLGKGLAYSPLMLNPTDALWLDAQRFGVTGIARLFGLPASWMLADSGQGGNLTYTNLLDARSDTILTTFLAYATAIEEAFTLLTPRGQTASLSADALLRASTNQRYASYTQGLNGKWLTVAEIRALEGLPPLGATTPPADDEGTAA